MRSVMWLIILLCRIWLTGRLLKMESITFKQNVIQLKNERLFLDICSLELITKLSTLETTIFRYSKVIHKVINIWTKKVDFCSMKNNEWQLAKMSHNLQNIVARNRVLLYNNLTRLTPDYKCLKTVVRF